MPYIFSLVLLSTCHFQLLGRKYQKSTHEKYKKINNLCCPLKHKQNNRHPWSLLLWEILPYPGHSWWFHPYRQGVTHDRSRKLKWPLFCALSRTKSQILPPILHKNKENFALQNTPFFTKSRTIFQNYPICAKARTWFFAAFCITNQPNWYFWSQIVDSHYQSNP